MAFHLSLYRTLFLFTHKLDVTDPSPDLPRPLTPQKPFVMIIILEIEGTIMRCVLQKR